jgi:hypothetical protein
VGADVHGEFAGHQRGLQWLGMGRVGPEVSQEKRRTGLGGLAHAPEQILVLLGRPLTSSPP